MGTAGHRRSVARLPGRLSPQAALDDALAGIAAIDDDLSAFVAIDADGARRAVAELKCGRWRGQQHGVPIVVQELFDVALRARAELTWLFEHVGYPVIASQANFILVQASDEHALVSRLAEHAMAVRSGTALGIPDTVRISVPSQRGLRLLHSALRPTTGRSSAGSC